MRETRRGPTGPGPARYLHAAAVGLRLRPQPLAVAALGAVPTGHGLLQLRLPLHAAGGPPSAAAAAATAAAAAAASTASAGQELRLWLLLRGLAALRHPRRRSPGRPPPRSPRSVTATPGAAG